MPSKPPFHKQETRYSCVPACLRMVFGSFGVDIAEGELRERCDCTYYGTDALKAIDAARQFGFTGTAKHNLTLEELRKIVADGRHPIVFVDLTPIDGTEDIHTLVVVAVSQYEVSVLDPLKGERLLPLQAFNTAWALRHNLGIIVER
jgi:ABC-type bacteriocin/lantibiotic exporter with double-glycine peptidase domain